MSNIEHVEQIKTTRLGREFLEKIKYFYDFKSKTLSKYSITDNEGFQKLQKQILKIQSIEELKQIRKKIFSVGMRSIQSFAIIEDFYDYLIKNAKVENIKECKNIKEEHLIDFLYQRSLINKTSTLMLYKVILGDLFRFLDKKCGGDFDFSLRNLSFNKEKTLPKFLPKPKFLNFIEYLKNKDFKKDYDKKNRLILLIVAFSGMRSQEVRNLKFSDLKPTYNKNGEEFYSIRITGKGNRQRMAMIKKESIQKYLIEWMSCDLKKRKYNTEYLFLNSSNKGSNTTRKFLLRTLKELKLLEEKESVGLHMLRHSFASYVYGESKDIVLVQNLLGHSSVETTQIYVHRTMDFSEQVMGLF